MENLCESEFGDEYQEWLLGGPDGTMRAASFDVQLNQLECGVPPIVEPGTPLRRVLKMMNEQRCGAVLVAHAERLCGIFTEHDFLRRVATYDVDLDDTTVAAVMTTSPDVLPETASLAQALRMMLRSGYRHLPLVDARGRAVACVSMRKIIEFVSETFPKEILNAPPERQSVAPSPEGA